MPAIITNKGKEIAARRLRGELSEPKYVAWGTDGGTALTLAATNTNLGAPAPEARAVGISTIVTTSTANDTCRVLGTLTANGAKTIREVGLFDAATGGNLFMRATFDPIVLESGDSIQFTIDVQFRGA